MVSSIPAIVALAAHLFAADSTVVSLSARLEPDSALVGETVVATITVEACGGAIAFRNPEQIPLRDLRIVSASHSRSLERSGESGPVVRRDIFLFTLTPLSAGMCYVQPFTLHYTRDGDTGEYALHTPALEVLARPRPEESGTAFALLLGIAFAALVGGGLFVLSRKRRRAAAAPSPDERSRIARRHLERLKLVPPDAPDMTRELFAVLRDFAREYFATDRPLATCAAVKELLAENGIDKMNGWLDETDRALFGKHAPDGSAELRRMRLKNFLREFKGGDDASGD